MIEVRRRPAPNGRISRVVAGFLNQGQDPPTRLSQLLVYGTVASIWNSSMANSAIQKTAENGPESAIVRTLGARSIVLVGMMGAGKSSVGRRLAARLAIPFVDADSEIESAAGMTIPEIFDKHGEDYFRAVLVEDFRNGHAGGAFDLAIGIDKGNREPGGEPAADRRLAGAHHADQHDGTGPERAHDRRCRAVFRRFFNGTVSHARVPNRRHGSIYQ